MRKTILALSLIALLPVAAQAEYEPGLTPRQTALKNVLLDNHAVMNRETMGQVKALIDKADMAAKAGQEKEADMLISQAMRLVSDAMFLESTGKGLN